MPKTILLLGGSRQQVVAIEAAKKLGYRTVLCDYLPDNPGQYHADVFYQVSTTDREAVLEVAQKETVNGVLAYASDPASPTAAYVAEQLNLPTNPLKAVEIMSTKHLFRDHMRRVGLPCPFYVELNIKDEPQKWESKIADANLAFPIVVKPTDSSGSKGVSVVETPDLLTDAVNNASLFGRNGIVIAEEFINRTFPNVIGGDVFVIDGQVRFWGIMSCLRNPEMDLIPVGEYTPCGLNGVQYSNLQKVIQQLITSLHIRFGELNIEVLIGENNVPYVLELGSRAGGNMIPVELSDASNIDLVDANVLCAMGESPQFESYQLEDAVFATYVLHSLQDGILQDIVISKELQNFVYRQVTYIDFGERVEQFNGANKAIGIIFLRFDTEEQMLSLLKRIYSLVEIKLAG